METLYYITHMFFLHAYFLFCIHAYIPFHNITRFKQFLAFSKSCYLFLLIFQNFLVFPDLDFLFSLDFSRSLGTLKIVKVMKAG